MSIPAFQHLKNYIDMLILFLTINQMRVYLMFTLWKMLFRIYIVTGQVEVDNSCY